MRFGRLVVVERAENKVSKSGKNIICWLCFCDCGNMKIVLGGSLKAGKTISCGCYHKEIASKNLRTHGLKRHELYPSWLNLKQRCTNPNNPYYANYGGRGIVVCGRWMQSFENFLEDMGERPSDKHSIDRIDNDKGYFPENCRWATRSEQNMNTRNRKDNTSGKRGVYFEKKSNKWHPYIRINGRNTSLGYFTDFNDAVKAREDAELKYFGKLL